MRREKSSSLEFGGESLAMPKKKNRLGEERKIST